MDDHMHPGVFLKTKVMEPLGLSTRAIATAISIRRETVLAFTRGYIDVTKELAEALGKYFDMTPCF